jgi:hypothetical protein
VVFGVYLSAQSRGCWTRNPALRELPTLFLNVKGGLHNSNLPHKVGKKKRINEQPTQNSITCHDSSGSASRSLLLSLSKEAETQPKAFKRAAILPSHPDVFMYI